MPPQDRIWEDPAWSWVCSNKNPASDRKLDDAARAAWPYACLCSWTYLNDQDTAHDLMYHAVQNACGYLERHTDVSIEKVIARIKSVIRRYAKQLAAKKKLELASGSLNDLEKLYTSEPESEQRAYAKELFARLSPFAQSVVRWRWLGYTWREIAAQLEMDHTVVRRAYLREVQSLLAIISRNRGAS